MKQIQDENRGMSTLIEKIKVKRTKLSRILATVCRILFAPSLYIFNSFLRRRLFIYRTAHLFFACDFQEIALLNYSESLRWVF